MRAPASTPRVGSSARSTTGCASDERANSTFCWLPPESDEIGVSCGRRPDRERAICSRDRAWLSDRRRTTPRRAMTRARAARRSRARRATAARPRDGGRRAGRRCRLPDACPGSGAPTGFPATRPCPAPAPAPRARAGTRAGRCPRRPASPTISPGVDLRSTSWKPGPSGPRPRAAARPRSAAACFSGKICSTERPTIRRQDLVLGDGGGRERAAHLAVAEDGDAVGDALHLGQPVGDVDDRVAALA